MKRFTLLCLGVSAGLMLFVRAPRAEDSKANDLAPLIAVVAEVKDEAVRLDVLKGMRAGLKGRKKVAMPAGWSKLYPSLAKSSSAELRREAEVLAMTFGDPQVLADLKKEMKNARADANRRRQALRSLVDHAVPIAEELLALLDDKAVQSDAIEGLAAFENSKTAAELLKRFKSFSSDNRQRAIGTLASRREWADALLAAVENKAVAHSEISAFSARQIQALGDKSLTAKLRRVWGDIREASADKVKLIAQFKKRLPTKFLANANLSAGRALYKKTCQKCHKLFGEGGKVGPDLTGSNRANLDYVLENILAPSALIGKDYQMVVVRTDRSRTVTGIIVERTSRSITIRTADRDVVLSTDEIDRMKISELSMMPEGQVKDFTRRQLRDLIGYLASPKQVPLPKGAK